MTLKPLGDSAWLVEFAGESGAAALARVMGLVDALENDRPAGVLDVVPSFASLAVHFDSADGLGIRDWIGSVGGPELDDIAQQAADDALMTIVGKLEDFRGASRFTTWAYKFAMFEVSAKMARHAWRERPLALDEAAWERLPDRLALLPESAAEQRELLSAVRRAVEEELTDHQRHVFVAAALNDIPIDTLALEIGSNRNAVYKTLFDARRKLRASLAASGHTLQRT